MTISWTFQTYRSKFSSYMNQEGWIWTNEYIDSSVSRNVLFMHWIISFVWSYVSKSVNRHVFQRGFVTYLLYSTCNTNVEKNSDMGKCHKAYKQWPMKSSWWWFINASLGVDSEGSWLASVWWDDIIIPTVTVHRGFYRTITAWWLRILRISMARWMTYRKMKIIMRIKESLKIGLWTIISNLLIDKYIEKPFLALNTRFDFQPQMNAGPYVIWMD